MTYLVPSANSARFLEVHSLEQSKASFLYHVTPPSTTKIMKNINLRAFFVSWKRFGMVEGFPFPYFYYYCYQIIFLWLETYMQFF